MKFAIKNVVKNLQLKTAVDVNVYDMLGTLVASTGGIKRTLAADITVADFSDGIYRDRKNNVTWFTVTGGYMGAVEGCDQAASNYAYMLAAMIDNAVIKSDANLSRADNFRAILLKEATKEQINRFIARFSIPNLPASVIAISVPKDKQGEVLNLVMQFAAATDETLVIDEQTLCYIKFNEQDEDYQSSVNFAETLFGSIVNELNVKCVIGVGMSVGSPIELDRSYDEAMSAIRMSMMVNGHEGVFSYKEYILLKMIEDLPPAKLKQYLTSLIDSGATEILSDGAIIATGEEFLNTSLNISETSKNLYMHRNTLIYRLDKIEKAMGLNIRKFPDAVTFRIITILYKLLKK